MRTTLYDLLQVSRSADPEIIEAAYQKLLQKYQTDGRLDSQSQLNLIQHAYEVLSNSVKKSEYDQSISSQPPNQPEAQVQISPSQYKSAFANSSNDWWESQKLTGIIVAIIALIAFALFANYALEQKRIEIAKQSELIKRQETPAEAGNFSKNLNNQAPSVADGMGNRGNYIYETTQEDEMRKQLQNEQRRQVEQQRQQVNEQRHQVEQQSQRYENEAAARQAQQLAESERVQLFNKLVFEHRYREAADIARTPSEVSQVQQLAQAENRPQSVDKSTTLECQQAQRSYDTAAFRNQPNDVLIVKKNLMQQACGTNPPSEVNIYRN